MKPVCNPLVKPTNGVLRFLTGVPVISVPCAGTAVAIIFVLLHTRRFGLQCTPTGTILLAINAAVRPGSRNLHPNHKESLETMKKLLTLLFAAALTLTLSSAAFAQESAGGESKDAKKEAGAKG